MSALHVCPLSALEDVIEETGACRLISMSGPGKELTCPASITNGFLRLVFNDISEPQSDLIAPNADHIRSLLKFCDDWDHRKPMVIHCWLGISRSTAAAFILLAARNPDCDFDALAQLLRHRSPQATPNPMMIAVADDLLGCGGRMVHAIERIGRGSDAFEGEPFSIGWDE